MNVRLLKRVRQTIADQPKRYCAAHWAFARNKRAVLDAGAPPDGFKCCIAGHVLLEEDGGDYDEKGLLCDGGFHDTGYLWQRAAEAAGLSKAQRNELFFPSQWDAPFKERYYLSKGAEEADVSAAYIDYFLDKHAAADNDSEEPAEASAGAGREERLPAPDRPPVAGAADREAEAPARGRTATRFLKGAFAAAWAAMLSLGA